MVDMVRHSLRWGNPNTEPPGPRVLKAVILPRHQPCPAEIMELWTPGGGYAVCWELVTQKPIRRWSQEARARVRKNNLRRRLVQKFPLFAETFIAEELAKRPDYFAGSY